MSPEVWAWWTIWAGLYTILPQKLQHGTGSTSLTKPLLAVDWRKRTKVSTDAPKAGLGAVLLQEYDTRSKHIACVAWQLTEWLMFGTGVWMWRVSFVHLWHGTRSPALDNHQEEKSKWYASVCLGDDDDASAAGQLQYKSDKLAHLDGYYCTCCRCFVESSATQPSEGA